MKQKQKISFPVKIKQVYFQHMISINEEKHCSFTFGIIIEILRFFAGNSFVYSVFVVEKYDRNVDKIWYNGLKANFDESDSINQGWISIIVLSLITLQVIYTFSILKDQQFYPKLKTIKLASYIGILINALSQYIFSIMGIAFYVYINQQDYLIAFLITIQAFLMLIIFKISAIFQSKNQFQSEDIYVHNQNLSVQLNKIASCVICFIAPFIDFIGVPDVARFGLIIIWTSLQIHRLFKTVIFPYYQHQSIHKLYAFFTCFQTAQVLILMLSYVLPISMIGQNQGYIMGIVTIFLFWSSLNYNRILVQEVYFTSIQEIKTKANIYLLINSFYSALKSLQKQAYSQQICLMVSSIRKNHERQCKNTQCYCHKEEQHELKKFLKSYLFDIVIKLQKNFSQNGSIKLYIYSFKFHMYHYFAKTYQELQTMTQFQKLSTFQILLAMQLQHRLKKWINHQNQKYKILIVSKAIRLQEDITSMNKIIINDIQTKYKKWSSLLKELSRANQIKQLSHQEIQNFIKMENIRSIKGADYSRSYGFNATLYFYFKKVALQTGDFIDLEENLQNLTHKIKEEDYNKSNLFLKHLFNKNACTVECSIKENDLGMILNTSKSVGEVFGYSKKHTIGEKISLFIPQFLASQHDSLMKQWAEKESQIDKISKSSQIYCRHRQNYSFIAKKYMNIYVGLQQITLNTTIFKIDENRLILINHAKEIESYGKPIRSILKEIPPHTKCNQIFKDMQQKISNAKQNQQKSQETIIRNDFLISRQINFEKRSVSSSINTNQENNNKKRNGQKGKYQEQKSKIHNDQLTINLNCKSREQFSESRIQWRVCFTYKKIKIGTLVYYKIEIKKLQQQNVTKQYLSTCRTIRSMKNAQKKNDYLLELNSDSNLANGEEEVHRAHQKKSVVSYATPLEYNVSKMVIHYCSIMLNPSKLTDKRMKIRLIIDILLPLCLITILSTILAVNKYSLQQKVASLKGKAAIDKVLHLVQASTNHIINMYMYKDNEQLKQIAIKQSIWDEDEYFQQVQRQFIGINSQKTLIQGEKLYQYLRTSLNLTFKKNSIVSIEIFSFFQTFFYLFKEIRNQWQSPQTNLTTIAMLYKFLTINIGQLRPIRDNLVRITGLNISDNKVVSQLFMIITFCLFCGVSGSYALLLNNDKKFRFNQKQNHVKLYEMIPHQTLASFSSYYSEYYQYFVLNQNKIQSVFQTNQEQNMPKDSLELQVLEDSKQNYFMLSKDGKRKLFNNIKYFSWIGILAFFLIINGGNGLISYQMYRFNVEVEYFSSLCNDLSTSQATLITRWIRFKSVYLFSRQEVNLAFVDYIFARVDGAIVKFGKYAVTKDNWITEDQPTFRKQFNQLLTTDPCVLNNLNYTVQQLKICSQQSKLSKNGIIIYVNSLSRSLRNILLQFKGNLTGIINEPNHLVKKKEFREIDFMSTFNGPTFAKLNQKIIDVYENGFSSEFTTYFAVFMCLIVGIIIGLLKHLWKLTKDREDLSRLYGYVVLIHVSALKNNQKVVAFINSNLQFDGKY